MLRKIHPIAGKNPPPQPVLSAAAGSAGARESRGRFPIRRAFRSRGRRILGHRQGFIVNLCRMEVPGAHDRRADVSVGEFPDGEHGRIRKEKNGRLRQGELRRVPGTKEQSAVPVIVRGEISRHGPVQDGGQRRVHIEDFAIGAGERLVRPESSNGAELVVRVEHSAREIEPFPRVRQHAIGPVEVVDVIRAFPCDDPGDASASRRRDRPAARDSEFARPGSPVRDGDELAFFPPVSGG